jgi:hypothetical protein
LIPLLIERLRDDWNRRSNFGTKGQIYLVNKKAAERFFRYGKDYTIESFHRGEKLQNREKIDGSIFNVRTTK